MPEYEYRKIVDGKGCLGIVAVGVGGRVTAVWHRAHNQPGSRRPAMARWFMWNNPSPGADPIAALRDQLRKTNPGTDIVALTPDDFATVAIELRTGLTILSWAALEAFHVIAEPGRRESTRRLAPASPFAAAQPAELLSKLADQCMAGDLEPAQAAARFRELGDRLRREGEWHLEETPERAPRVKEAEACLATLYRGRSAIHDLVRKERIAAEAGQRLEMQWQGHHARLLPGVLSRINGGLPGL